jgi:hypothetical protein
MIAKTCTQTQTTTMITEAEARVIAPHLRRDDLPVFVGDYVLHTIHEDDQETEYDLAPITMGRGVVTELELRAVALVNVAELIAEPLNTYDIARGAVKLAGKVARIVRGPRG